LNAASPSPSRRGAPPAGGAARAGLPNALLIGLRAGAAATGLLLGVLSVSAVAAPPESWDNTANVSMLVALLKLVGIPLVVIAVVTLLVYLPGMMRGSRSSADSTSWFSEHSEWFGGPRTTPEALESPATAPEGRAATRGGASARW
jgi:hypothetical protein